jgi:hypothetical protein
MLILLAWLAFSYFFEGGSFVHGQMHGLVAFDQILGLFFRSVDDVPFERDFRRNLFLDGSPNPARFKIPLDMVSDLEIAGHCFPFLG